MFVYKVTDLVESYVYFEFIKLYYKVTHKDI